MKYKAMLAAVMVAGLTITVSGQVNKAEALLGTALHQEEVEANCLEAIKTFQKVIQEKNAPKPIAARAQLHIGVCQEKLGRGEARLAYELVLNRYGDQAGVVSEAQERLARLGGLRVERILEGLDIGEEGRPSDDGRLFVFVDWTSEFGNLAVRDLRTGEKRVLTSDTTADSFVENPVPSPDGKRIAYRFGETNSSIRLINADGTDMKVLLRDGHNNFLYAWSPDKKYIAAVHTNDDGTNSIVRISTADGSLQQLKTAGTAYPDVGTYSPDGRFLLYARNNDPKDGEGGVFALAADGSRLNRLVEGSRQGPTSFNSPFWSPDGRRVIFRSNRSGEAGIWSIRVVDGKPEGDPERVRLSPDNGMQARAFTQDGSLYYLKREIQVEAYAGDFDSVTMKVLNYKPLTDRAVGNNRGPELSPDGTQVAFIRRSRTGGWAVMVRPAGSDGEERSVGTINGSGAYGARTLQWFPDGRSLLVIDGANDGASDSRKKRFRRIDVQSGEAQPVFEGPWTVWTGTISADGSSVYYSVKEEGTTLRLVKRQITTGDETELYRVDSLGTGLFSLVASPDGRSLAFSRNVDVEHRGLFVMPTDGGIPRELYRSNYVDKVWPKEMRWTSDSKNLLVVGDGSTGDSLHIIPAEGGTLKPLGLREAEILTVSISPNGRRIVFGGRTVSEEFWVVRNLLSGLAK